MWFMYETSDFKACFLWFATMITLRFDYIRTMRVNGLQQYKRESLVYTQGFMG